MIGFFDVFAALRLTQHALGRRTFAAHDVVEIRARDYAAQRRFLLTASCQAHGGWAHRLGLDSNRNLVALLVDCFAQMRETHATCLHIRWCCLLALRLVLDIIRLFARFASFSLNAALHRRLFLYLLLTQRETVGPCQRKFVRLSKQNKNVNAEIIILLFESKLVGRS